MRVGGAGFQRLASIAVEKVYITAATTLVVGGAGSQTTSSIENIACMLMRQTNFTYVQSFWS